MTQDRIVRELDWVVLRDFHSFWETDILSIIRTGNNIEHGKTLITSNLVSIYLYIKWIKKAHSVREHSHKTLTKVEFLWKSTKCLGTHPHRTLNYERVTS